jgi:Chlorophyll A-B binding protein
MARSGAIMMKVDMVGSSAPLGFFDPLGFSKGADAATLAKYRESELKHGRVAMLAVLGVLTQEKWHPLYEGKLSGNPLDAFVGVPPAGFVQIIAFVGLIEYYLSVVSKQEGFVPGDYLGVAARVNDVKDPSWVGIQTRELNNGRLAMFAIMGELAHAAITGKGPLAYYGI